MATRKIEAAGLCRLLPSYAAVRGVTKRVTRGHANGEASLLLLDGLYGDGDPYKLAFAYQIGAYERLKGASNHGSRP